MLKNENISRHPKQKCKNIDPLSYQKENLVRVDFAKATNALLNSGIPPIIYWTKKEILDGDDTEEKERLQESPPVRKLISKQLEDGSWKYPSRGGMLWAKSYKIIQTLKSLTTLIVKYDFDRGEEAVDRAAGFLFGTQTEEGDFRGVYLNQYTPNYHSWTLELLVKAGYDDERVRRAFEWLLEIRQSDGGWTIPFRTHRLKGKSLKEAFSSPRPIEPDKTRPFSHVITGVVLRAFAAHPEWRKDEEIKRVSKMLASRFFKSDKYPDRRASEYWEKLIYPFWFTDILSSLDVISTFGLAPNDPDVAKGIEWLIRRQRENGLWPTGYPKGAARKEADYWVTLAALRVFKRFGLLGKNRTQSFFLE